VIAVLVVWRYATGRIEFENIASRQNEIFYWVTIPMSNTRHLVILSPPPLGSVSSAERWCSRA
jgi:hypothetical protein